MANSAMVAATKVILLGLPSDGYLHGRIGPQLHHILKLLDIGTEMMKRAFTSEAVYEPKAICIHQLGRLWTGESLLFYNKKELQGLK